MQVQGWKHVDVGFEFVVTNFWTLFLTLFACLITHIAIKTVKWLLAPDFLKLSEKEVHSIQNLVNGESLLNKGQCRDLSSKLSETIQNIQELVSGCRSSTGRFRLSLEHLYRVLVKARLLVNDCSRKNWVAASVFHIQNENAFQVILLEVGLYYHAIYEQSKGMSEGRNFQVKDLRDSSTFQPARPSDVNGDREVLKGRLEDLINRRNSSRLLLLYHIVLERISKKLRLARYLLAKLDCLPQRSLPNGSELSENIMWTEKSYTFCTWGRDIFLGKGSGSSGVSKTRWLGIPCAKKFNIPKPYFLKEACILFHANHPNIAKFICCGNGPKGDHFIVLELMEMSLSKLIQKQAKKKIQFPHHVAIDIIAQLARGMCYLHGMKVAHRDLKADNVVLDILSFSRIAGTYYVKLVDFGTSKTQVEPFETTSTDHGFGTLTHKAPEVRYLEPGKDRKWRAIWFKADVWSFAITCLQILSLQHEFEQYKNPDVKSILHTDYPNELIALLEDCLQAKDPRSRPDFLQICTRLETLRHNLLRGLPAFDHDLQEIGMDSKSHKFIEEKLEEHFRIQIQNAVIIDDEVEASMQHVSDLLPSEQGHSQESTRMDQAAYYKFSKETTRQAIDSVKGGTLEFNVSLCECLTHELSSTEVFLIIREPHLNGSQGVSESKRVALLQLYSVVKQAETLLHKCCKRQDSQWPARALPLLAIKEDVLDIILHLQWWMSILDIVIISTQKRSCSEIVDSLKRADKDFETMLDALTSSDSELQKAAVKDTELLLNKTVEFLKSDNGESGINLQENHTYLLSNQIHSLLTDEEAIGNVGLNEFELVQVIGLGGYGVVSQVKWCGYDAALKVKHSFGFDWEAKILKSFHHPHIVQFFSHFEDKSKSRSHILMERMLSDLGDYMAAVQREKPLQSKDLVDRKRNPEQPPFSNAVAIDTILQVAKAVWHMHSKKVIHRNLKPSKILVRRVHEDEVPELAALGFLQVKVGGFDLAKENVMSFDEGPLTPRVGTTRYMSPEVILGWPEGENYPHKAESWSFGIMCAEVLSGERPYDFPGIYRGIRLHAELESGVRPWIPESCPDYLKFCVESCWKYNPKERPRFSDIWRMFRFAKLRSLGLINQNFDLFKYTDDDGYVVELMATPTTEIPAWSPNKLVNTGYMSN